MPVIPATREAETGESLGGRIAGTGESLGESQEARIAPLHSSLGDRVRLCLQIKK